MRRLNWVNFLIIWVIWGMADSVHAMYYYEDLGTLGGDYSSASGINASGQVVGSASAPGGYTHAFLKNPGEPMQDLGTLGGDYSSASGINASGQVVGSASAPGGYTHAFLKNPGEPMQDLGTLGNWSNATAINNNGQVIGSYGPNPVPPPIYNFLKNPGQPMRDLGIPVEGRANGINDSGQIVGIATFFIDNNYYRHAFLKNTEGPLQSLGTLDGDYSSGASGINNNGQIVGYSQSGYGYRAFLKNPGEPMHDLGSLSGYNYFMATSINASGQIVGDVWTSTPNYQATVFLKNPGQPMQDLNSLIINFPFWGARLEHATAINDSGQVVGNTGYHAFLLTPVRNPYLLISLPIPPMPMPFLPQVGNPFPVTITARNIDGTLNTGFNGYGNLSCPPVKLDKSRVYLTNGVWSGELTINYGVAANLVIYVSGGGISGRSISFSSSGTGSTYGALYGVVLDDGAILNTPLPNATVHLSRTPGGPDAYMPPTTDANGRYTFTWVTAGNYYLWATCYGSSSPANYQVSIPAYGMSQNLVVPTAGDPSKLPVILVPGITGSNDKDRYVVYPRLPKPDYDRNQLQLHDPAGKAGWQDLKEILGKNGKNVKVIDCPWDWRKPIDAAMKKYLKDAIRKAKGGNANQKVNIIAHSMGGLLARAYIQGDDYQNDVENLVLVGTPHTGSANAYYFWEGGDPETVDYFSPFGNIIRYYSNTIKKLMQDLKWPLTGEQDYQNKRTFIYYHLPTARQLLPTYAFLDHGSGPQPITSSGDINYDLKDLNSGSNGYTKPGERMGLKNGTGRVRTKVYYSAPPLQNNTIGNIMVKNSTITGLYEDGQPIQKQVSFVEGDGTVPRNSAMLPFLEGWADEIEHVTESHASLIDKAKERIVDYLYPTVATAMLFKEAAPATLSPTFFVTYDGWLQPYLVDSLGRAVGFNLTSDALENTIPQARLVTEADCGSLAVDNPADGLYILSLKGRSPGAYRLSINYQSEGNFVTRDLEGFNNANTTTITILVDSTNPAKIILNPQVPAPTAVTASNAQGKTYLTWQTSAGAVSYKIYAMIPGASDFNLIGSTADTNFMTNDPWLLDGSSTPTMYVVVAVKADGTESFFSNIAVNKTVTPVIMKKSLAPIISLLLAD